jgi:hypothetical protein
LSRIIIYESKEVWISSLLLHTPWNGEITIWLGQKTTGFGVWKNLYNIEKCWDSSIRGKEKKNQEFVVVWRVPLLYEVTPTHSDHSDVLLDILKPIYIYIFFFEDGFFVVRRCNVAHNVRRGPTGSIFRLPRQRMTVDPVRDVASSPSAARNIHRRRRTHTRKYIHEKITFNHYYNLRQIIN